MSPSDLHAIPTIALPCCLCGSERKRDVCSIVDTTYGVSGVYTVVKCLDCQHLYLDPRPTDEVLLDCYPQDYAPYHQSDAGGHTMPPEQGLSTRAAAETKASWRRIVGRWTGLRWLLNWLGQENATWLPNPPRPGDSRLLEIGCAHGGFLEQARQAGWLAQGVEPSPQAAGVARDRGFEVYCGHLSEAPLPAGSQDLVVMWMVLEHVPNPIAMLQKTEELLRSGGYVALSVPNAGSWEPYVFGRHWLGYDAPRHLQMFSARRLASLLSSLGFTDIRIQHQSNTRYWWGSIASWGRLAWPQAEWPRRWMGYFRDEPPSWWKWIWIVPGKLAAVLRLSGRITVIARKS